jgi:hypothetical protein
MPMRAMLAFRSTLWVNTFVGKLIGGVNAVRFVEFTVTVRKSTSRYSALMLQPCHRPASIPPPATQPTLELEIDADSAALANVSVKLKSAFRSVNATPPVP